MKRKVVLTDDGSSSIYVPELGEHYHSHFGAMQESKHIFINSALSQIKKDEISVLEFGFGTGLNALMTYRYAYQNDKKINYYTLEKYPLSKEEYESLNFDIDADASFFNDIHSVEWEKNHKINSIFNLFKTQIDFRDFRRLNQGFDIVYFDAFAPDVQPLLWSDEIFNEVFLSMNKGSVLTTYTVKGTVRRTLKSVGFRVEKIPGPIGKREITRAWK